MKEIRSKCTFGE